jgi:hypothetical protein
MAYYSIAFDHGIEVELWCLFSIGVYAAPGFDYASELLDAFMEIHALEPIKKLGRCVFYRSTNR